MTNQKAVLRVAPATLIIFSILFSPVFILGIQLILQFPKQLQGGGFVCFLYICIMYLIGSATVYFKENELTYRVCFFLRRSIDLETVTKVKVAANPAPTLVLQSKHSKPFKFVIKPFSRAGVALIINHIKLHAPNAEFDKISTDLGRGDFSSVTRETIRAENLFQLFGTVIGTMIVLGLARAATHSALLTAGIIVVAVLAFMIMVSRRRKK